MVIRFLKYGLFTAFAALSGAKPTAAQAPRTLSFQGVLTNPSGARKPDGAYSATFRVYDVKTGGSALWTEMKTVSLNAGVFTTVLGDITPIPPTVAFSDKTYYLGVSVGTDAEASPREILSGTPYALALPGLRTELTVLSNEPGEPGPAGTPWTPNIIGGHRVNYAGPGVKGATIAGGGFPGYVNRILDDYGSIGGGSHHMVGDGAGTVYDRFYGTVIGGVANTTGAAYASALGGHVVSAMGTASTAVGGYVIAATGDGSFVGSGNSNTVGGKSSVIGCGNYNQTYADLSVLLGGGAEPYQVWGGNHVTDTYGTVWGGADNQAGNGTVDLTDAPFSTVSGGRANTASGSFSAIPGGQNNVASGAGSFAAGTNAKATLDGDFVWADATAGDFAATSANQFNVRATGGVRIVTKTDSITHAPIAGVSLAPGDNAWSVLSDRNAKADFGAVDAISILRRVLALPVETWRYHSQEGVRHIGPMAQDFHALFGVGSDALHISTVDADGVAIAAIQGLYAIVRQQDARVSALTRRRRALEARFREAERVAGSLVKGDR